MGGAAGQDLTPAYVLHRRPYSDSSLLLDLFSRRDGRLALIARGATRSRGGQAASLQPFIPLLVSYSGRGEVQSLHRCEAAGPAVALQGEALYCGFYLNELLVRLLERREAHAALFAFYTDTLMSLADGVGLDSLLRRFELRLLDELGYGLVLGWDAESGESVSPDRRYHYHIDAGPVEVRLEEHRAADTVGGDLLLALAAGEFSSPELRRQARDFMRRILQHYLGPKPLKSRELFAQPGKPSDITK